MLEPSHRGDGLAARLLLTSCFIRACSLIAGAYSSTLLSAIHGFLCLAALASPRVADHGPGTITSVSTVVNVAEEDRGNVFPLATWLSMPINVIIA